MVLLVWIGLSLAGWLYLPAGMVLAVFPMMVGHKFSV